MPTPGFPRPRSRRCRSRSSRRCPRRGRRRAGPRRSAPLVAQRVVGVRRGGWTETFGARRRGASTLPWPVPRSVRSGPPWQEGDDQRADGEQGDHREQRDRVAHPERQPALGVGRQRADDRGRLAGRGALAGGLDGQRILEIGDQRRNVGVAVREVLSVMRSRTAAVVADTSGRRWMSGRSSRTCFIATAIWFSPWNGTSPVSIS